MDQALILAQKEHYYGVYSNQAVEMITYDAEAYYKIVHTLIPKKNRNDLNCMLDRVIQKQDMLFKPIDNITLPENILRDDTLFLIEKALDKDFPNQLHSIINYI